MNIRTVRLPELHLHSANCDALKSKHCSCEILICDDAEFLEDTEDPETPITEFFWIPPITQVMVQEIQD